MKSNWTVIGDVSKSDRGGFILTQLDKDQFDFKDALLKNDNSADSMIWTKNVHFKENGLDSGHSKRFYALKAKHRWILNLYKMMFFIPLMVLVRVSLRFSIVCLN